MDYIISTLQSHHWGHCKCTRYFLDQGNCKEISLENSECTSSAQVSIWWVLCPYPCSVFAVYQPGTPPFVPSDSRCRDHRTSRSDANGRCGCWQIDVAAGSGVKGGGAGGNDRMGAEGWGGRIRLSGSSLLAKSWVNKIFEPTLTPLRA